jgi:hypothetical protein
MTPPDAIDGVYYVGMTPQGQVRTPLSERALDETEPSPLLTVLFRPESRQHSRLYKRTPRLGRN